MGPFFTKIQTITLVKTTSENICSGKAYTQQAEHSKNARKYSEDEINKAWKNATNKRK